VYIGPKKRYNVSHGARPIFDTFNYCSKKSQKSGGYTKTKRKTLVESFLGAEK
jgi:hypothetical protein